MQRYLAGVAVALLAVAVFAVSATGETVRAGNLVLTVGGNVSPKKLPKKRMAPITLRLNGHIRTVDNHRADCPTPVFVIAQLRRVQEPTGHGPGEGRGVREWIPNTGSGESADGFQQTLRLSDQLFPAPGNLRIGRHIRPAAQGVLDGAPGDLAGFEDVLGCGGVMGFRMADDVINVRA